jgi:hypothetical protein
MTRLPPPSFRLGFSREQLSRYRTGRTTVTSFLGQRRIARAKPAAPTPTTRRAELKTRDTRRDTGPSFSILHSSFYSTFYVEPTVYCSLVSVASINKKATAKPPFSLRDQVFPRVYYHDFLLVSVSHKKGAQPSIAGGFQISCQELKCATKKETVSTYPML